MKTTIDIPGKALKEAIRHTGAKTAWDAIVTAAEEFNRRRCLEELAERLHGSCPGAGELARRCRQKGITALSADIVIAACAAARKLDLEHCDGYFNDILPLAKTLQASATTPVTRNNFS